MSEEKTNNPNSTPEGQVEKKAGGSEKDYSELSYEELTKKVKGEPILAEIEPEPVNEPEPEGEPEPEEPSKEEPVIIPEDELPDELKGKTAEELSKAYINLRKMQSKQTDELGQLRKYKKENESLDTEMKQYGINSTAKNLVEKEITKMTDEEKNSFYEIFSEDPSKALMPLISKAIQPLTVRQAKSDNETEIKRLIEVNKDGYVPYDRKKINKIIAGYTNQNGRNSLFDKYGLGAFEAAYDIYYKQNIGEALEKSQKAFKEKAIKEAEEAAKAQKNTFTEPQGKSSASQAGNPTNFDEMSYEELSRKVGKPKDD